MARLINEMSDYDKGVMKVTVDELREVEDDQYHGLSPAAKSYTRFFHLDVRMYRKVIPEEGSPMRIHRKMSSQTRKLLYRASVIEGLPHDSESAMGFHLRNISVRFKDPIGKIQDVPIDMDQDSEEWGAIREILLAYIKRMVTKSESLVDGAHKRMLMAEGKSLEPTEGEGS